MRYRNPVLAQLKAAAVKKYKEKSYQVIVIVNPLLYQLFISSNIFLYFARRINSNNPS